MELIQKDEILNILDKETKLRGKHELIKKFINENIPNIPAGGDNNKTFKDYWNKEKQASLLGYVKQKD